MQSTFLPQGMVRMSTPIIGRCKGLTKQFGLYELGRRSQLQGAVRVELASRCGRYFRTLPPLSSGHSKPNAYEPPPTCLSLCPTVSNMHEKGL